MACEKIGGKLSDKDLMSIGVNGSKTVWKAEEIKMPVWRQNGV